MDQRKKQQKNTYAKNRKKTKKIARGKAAKVKKELGLVPDLTQTKRLLLMILIQALNRRLTFRYLRE